MLRLNSLATSKHHSSLVRARAQPLELDSRLAASLELVQLSFTEPQAHLFDIVCPVELTFGSRPNVDQSSGGVECAGAVKLYQTAASGSFRRARRQP